MRTIKVSSVSEYIKELESLGIENYIYRGQNEPYFGIRANGFRPYMGGWTSDKIYNIDEISKNYYNRTCIYKSLLLAIKNHRKCF